MKNIKFRAWNKTVKKFTYFGNDEPSIEYNADDRWGMFLKATSGVYLSAYEEPQMYTGFKDSEGKEIYEGDIVKRFNDVPITFKDESKKYQTWVVDFKFGGWHFENTPLSPAISYPAFYSNANDMKVIGNNHENPELLKDKTYKDFLLDKFNTVQ